MLDKCIQNDPEEIGTKRVKAIPCEKLLYHNNSTPPLYSLEWDHTPCVETMCNFAAIERFTIKKINPIQRFSISFPPYFFFRQLHRGTGNSLRLNQQQMEN